MGKFFSNRVGQPAQSGAGAAGIEATNPPNLLAQKSPVDHELLPAKIEVGRKAVPYAPTSLDEILNLEQCASWLQQPASTLRRMIQDGRLKPLPFPGDDYRLHARTVLIQMGVMRDALDSSANFTEAKPDHPTQVAKRASLTNQREIHGPATGLQSEEPLAKEDDVCERNYQPESQPPVRRRPVSPSVPEPARHTKTKIVGKSYMSFGRKVQVTYVSGDSVQHRMAETALLDVLVNSR